MKNQPDFLVTVRRMIAQIDYLLQNGEVADFEAFNRNLDLMKARWLEYPDLSTDIQIRIQELPSLNVDARRTKHSWWSGISVFGIGASERFTVDDLREEIRPVRGMLSSIEFLFISTG
jgi:hypothetical protein